MGAKVNAVVAAGWTKVCALATKAVSDVVGKTKALATATRKIPYCGAMLVLHGHRAKTLDVNVVQTTVGPTMRVSIVGAPKDAKTLNHAAGMSNTDGNKTDLFYGAAVGYAFVLAKVGGAYAVTIAEFEKVCARYGLLTNVDFRIVNLRLKEWMADENADRTVAAMREAMELGRADAANKDRVAEAKAEADALKRAEAKSTDAKAKAAAEAENKLQTYVDNTSVRRMTSDAEELVDTSLPQAVAMLNAIQSAIVAKRTTAPATVPTMPPVKSACAPKNGKAKKAA